jgi:hypothetical protein
MYVTGTYDTRWDNGILNPAFGNLTASDFEVIQLGYNSTVSAPALSALSVNPSTVTGGEGTTGTVSLTSAAPAGGVLVSLSNANPAATIPSSVTVPAAAASVNFPVTTASVNSTTVGNLTASYSGVAKSATLTVNPSAPAALSALTLNPTTVRGGLASTATVTLTAPAPTGGLDVSLLSSNPNKAIVPATVKVPAGSSSVSFNVNTTAVTKKSVVTITANAGAVKKSAALTIIRR